MTKCGLTLRTGTKQMCKSAVLRRCWNVSVQRGLSYVLLLNVLVEFFWPGSNSPPSSMQHPFALHGNQTCSFPQLNIMSFISELLEQFEVKKPDFVKPIQPVNLTGSWLPTCFWGLNFYGINCVINKKNHSDELKVPCLLYMFFRHLRATRLYESCQREQQQVTESYEQCPDKISLILKLS